MTMSPVLQGSTAHLSLHSAGPLLSKRRWHCSNFCDCHFFQFIRVLSPGYFLKNKFMLCFIYVYVCASMCMTCVHSSCRSQKEALVPLGLESRLLGTEPWLSAGPGTSHSSWAISPVPLADISICVSYCYSQLINLHSSLTSRLHLSV